MFTASDLPPAYKPRYKRPWRFAPISRLFTLLTLLAAFSYASAQTPPRPAASADAAHKEHALKHYTGRCELETALIPISTLDVTLAGDELWLKPSLLKKRWLLDPANPDTEKDGAGNVNNVLVVPDR